MERIEKSVEVERPIRTVYNQWTQFEEFPRFMDGVKEVRQLDDTHVHWRASVAGKEKEWDAEITEQVPDEKIGWKSVSGDAPNAGVVRFEPLADNRTRVRLVMAYEPQGAMENVGDALGVLSASVQSSVNNFKKYIESRDAETGGWRGRVHDSMPGPGKAS
ncbi:MAG TPA: SRPBCC family protein [Gammaproteobacteria bacterium]|nr:SRPBCC family protein [Gammaproteobacteria bacterium]